MNSQPIDVVVLGAGVAGLTIAYRARQAGRTVKLFEKSNHVGGALHSERVDGYLLEYGPNTVQAKGEMLSLITDLGLEDHLLWAAPKLPRFVRRNGHLHPIPMSPGGILTTHLLSWPGRLRMLAEPFIPKLVGESDENLRDFATRRLGKEVADFLVAPYISGIWAGDSEKLSLAASFPTLHKWESHHGSLLRGALLSHKVKKKSKIPRGLISFYDGLETLPKTLARHLGEDIQLNTSIEEIFPEQKVPGEILWCIQTSHHTLTARNVVLAIPAFESADLVSRFSHHTAAALEAIPYTSLAVLHLGFKQDMVGINPHGFGFLTVPAESPDILGCLWSSSLFGGRAPENHHLFTVFMGGSKQIELMSLPDNELLNKALTSLKPIMKLKGRPSFIRVARHKRAIPQYNLGHGRRVLTLAKAEKLFPGLKFAGNYLEGISVGDVIRQATTLAGSEL